MIVQGQRADGIAVVSGQTTEAIAAGDLGSITINLTGYSSAPSVLSAYMVSGTPKCVPSIISVTSSQVKVALRNFSAYSEAAGLVMNVVLKA